MGDKGAKGRKPSVASQHPAAAGANVDRDGKVGLGAANANLTTSGAGTKSFRKGRQGADK
jgi:hypothetical protein